MAIRAHRWGAELANLVQTGLVIDAIENDGGSPELANAIESSTPLG